MTLQPNTFTATNDKSLLLSLLPSTPYIIKVPNRDLVDPLCHYPVLRLPWFTMRRCNVISEYQDNMYPFLHYTVVKVCKTKCGKTLLDCNTDGDHTLYMHLTRGIHEGDESVFGYLTDESYYFSFGNFNAEFCVMPHEYNSIVDIEALLKNVPQ